MDLDDYRNIIRRLRDRHKDNKDLQWGRPNLRPSHGPFAEIVGWKSTFVGTFSSNAHFVRLKETWLSLRRGPIERRVFSFHYGPYEEGWDLAKVKSKAVVVRIDSEEHDGRGCHIHIMAKDRRVFQSDISSPELLLFAMPDFVDGVLAIRHGTDVENAFRLAYK